MELWESVLSCIEKRVSHQNFDIWFKPTVLKREDLGKKRLFVQVPNKHFKSMPVPSESSLQTVKVAHISFQQAYLQKRSSPGEEKFLFSTMCFLMFLPFWVFTRPRSERKVFRRLFPDLRGWPESARSRTQSWHLLPSAERYGDANDRQHQLPHFSPH